MTRAASVAVRSTKAEQLLTRAPVSAAFPLELPEEDPPDDEPPPSPDEEDEDPVDELDEHAAISAKNKEVKRILEA